MFLAPSHCRLLGTMSSVSVMDTHFQVCAQEIRSIAIRHEKWGQYVSYSANPAALYPRRLTKAHKLQPSDCYWASLTEIDEYTRGFLVQRTIDTIVNNCNANYSVFSMFPHGPVVNKFYCPDHYFYLPRDVWICLDFNLLNSSKRPSERKPIFRRPTFACDT